jgi:hypothetical protein
VKRAGLAMLLGLLACGPAPLSDRTFESTSGKLTYAATATEFEGKDELTWNNSGTQALISWEGTTVTQGSVVFQLFDGAGKLVYELAATPGATPPKGSTISAGATNNWKGTVIYRAATARVVLEAQGAR